LDVLVSFLIHTQSYNPKDKNPVNIQTETLPKFGHAQSSTSDFIILSLAANAFWVSGTIYFSFNMNANYGNDPGLYYNLYYVK